MPLAPSKVRVVAHRFNLPKRFEKIDRILKLDYPYLTGTSKDYFHFDIRNSVSNDDFVTIRATATQRFIKEMETYPEYLI
jgi:hypothetical protein